MLPGLRQAIHQIHLRREKISSIKHMNRCRLSSHVPSAKLFSIPRTKSGFESRFIPNSNFGSIETECSLEWDCRRSPYFDILLAGLELGGSILTSSSTWRFVWCAS